MLKIMIYYLSLIIVIGLVMHPMYGIPSPDVCYEKSSRAAIAAYQLQTLTGQELDSDWRLNDFFGHIKVIGDKASPRYPLLLEKLKEVGLEESQFELSPVVHGSSLSEMIWSRVPAWAAQEIATKQGIAGCSMAHYYLIKDTRDRYKRALQRYTELKKKLPANIRRFQAAKKELKKYSSVLIIEDNNAFGRLHKGKPLLTGMGIKFRETLMQLPEDWDMFYFICMHGFRDYPRAQTVPHCPLILKAVYGLVTKCFAVRSTAYDALTRYFERCIFASSNGELLPADHIVARLHSKLNAYIAKEPLAYRFSCPSMVGSHPGVNVSRHHWQPIPH